METMKWSHGHCGHVGGVGLFFRCHKWSIILKVRFLKKPHVWTLFNFFPEGLGLVRNTFLHPVGVFCTLLNISNVHIEHFLIRTKTCIYIYIYIPIYPFKGTAVYMFGVLCWGHSCGWRNIASCRCFCRSMNRRVDKYGSRCIWYVRFFVIFQIFLGEAWIGREHVPTPCGSLFHPVKHLQRPYGIFFDKD